MFKIVLAIALQGLLIWMIGHSEAALAVSPHFGSPPLPVHVTMTVVPNPKNRAVCLVWNSDMGETGHTCSEVTETGWPHHKEITIGLHEPGTYEFVLVVERTDNRIQTPPQIVEVR